MALRLEATKMEILAHARRRVEYVPRVVAVTNECAIQDRYSAIFSRVFFDKRCGKKRENYEIIKADKHNHIK